MDEQKNEPQTIDAASVQALDVALKRAGSNIAAMMQEAEFYRIKAQQEAERAQMAEANYTFLVKQIEKAGLTVDELVKMAQDASESAQDASESPDSGFPVSSPVEEEDDASAAS